MRPTSSRLLMFSLSLSLLFKTPLKTRTKRRELKPCSLHSRDRLCDDVIRPYKDGTQQHLTKSARRHSRTPKTSDPPTWRHSGPLWPTRRLVGWLVFLFLFFLHVFLYVCAVSFRSIQNGIDARRLKMVINNVAWPLDRVWTGRFFFQSFYAPVDP